MNNFVEELTRAAAEPVPSPSRTPYDDVLDQFITFLTKHYPELHAWTYDREGVGPGDRHIRLVVSPRGRRTDRASLLELNFMRSGVYMEGWTTVGLASPEDLEKSLLELVRTAAFRRVVDERRKMSVDPVTGVLHAREMPRRIPSEDVPVTISADEQAKLAEASEATPRQPITLRVQIPGSGDAGEGTYAPGATLRWLVSHGYGLALDGHALEGPNVVRLSGTPVDPASLE